MTNNIGIIDPVQSLVDYVNDIKPFHTKIVEVLVDNVGFDFVNATIKEKHIFDTELIFNYDISMSTTSLCENGYGSSFGTTNNLYISSPNISITDADYPSINTTSNSFIVVGDHRDIFNIGLTTTLASFVESTIEGYSLSSIFVRGDVSINIASGDVISVMQAGVNDGNYRVSNVTYNIGTNQTSITIEGVLSTNETLGTVKKISVNSGTYTISDVEFIPGTIDKQIDPSDDLTTVPGTKDHTIVYVDEALDTYPTLAEDQRFVAFVIIGYIQIDNIFPHSNASTFISTTDFIQQPDEGINTFTISESQESSRDESGVLIEGSGWFKIQHDLSKSNVNVGDVVRVYNSISNNGTYTLYSIEYDTINATTKLYVNEHVESSVATGKIELFVLSNTLTVVGDHTKHFKPGTRFAVVSGSLYGTFTSLYVRYVPTLGITYIRPIEILPLTGTVITGVTTIASPANTYVFEVLGDLTSQYTEGTVFKVFNSFDNDGQYVVSFNSWFDGIKTYIPTQTHTNSLIVSGSLTIFKPGYIKVLPVGYSYSSIICEHVPATYIRTIIKESLKFDGIESFHDDVIVYNLENSNNWGFQLPPYTALSSIEPTISLIEPLTPTYGDLWFDDYTNEMYYWDDVTWVRLTKFYWLNTDTMILYYRIINQYNDITDTNWVQDFASTPGFSSVTLAIPSREIVSTEIFSGVGFGTEPSYVLSAPVIYSNLVVYVNGVKAKLVEPNDINSEVSSFTIISPTIYNSDSITAIVYADSGTNLNAYVRTFNEIPHTIFHPSVIVENNVFKVYGGNFIERLTKESFVGFNKNNNTISGPYVSAAAVVLSSTSSSLTISGDWTTYFESGDIVQTINDSTLELVSNYVVSYTSLWLGNTTLHFNQTVDVLPTHLWFVLYRPSTFTTHVLPTSLPDSNTTGITYDWLGPLRLIVNDGTFAVKPNNQMINIATTVITERLTIEFM